MTLEAYYPLTGSDAQDYSGNENNGTLNGGVTTGAAGILGETAFEFDGIDDYVDTQFTHPTNVTFSFWFNPSNLDGTRQFLYGNTQGADNGTYVVINDAGSLGLQTYDGDFGGIDVSVGLSEGEWQHYTGVIDDNGDGTADYKLYYNGAVEEEVDSDDYDPADSNAYIGANFNENQGQDEGNFQGKISNFRIYSRALSPPEIQYLYEVTQRGQALTSVKTA